MAPSPPSTTTTSSSSSSSTSKYGSPLHYFAAIESFFNLAAAIPMIFTPSKLLSLILVRPTTTSSSGNPAIVHPATLGLLTTPAPALTQLTQYLGALLVVLTVPLIYAIPDGPSEKAASSSTLARAARAEAGRLRRKVYVALATGEALLVGVLVAQLVSLKTPSGDVGGLKPGFMLSGVVALADIVALRVWALVCREGWFGGAIFDAAAVAAGGPERKKNL